ncbi:hypothetical protein IW262DRAFT_1466891 [Armillaria fumosa]|nr:hypothetical protein IW262DRAFT_1466891 [Armillaria fumosa]
MSVQKREDGASIVRRGLSSPDSNPKALVIAFDTLQMLGLVLLLALLAPALLSRNVKRTATWFGMIVSVIIYCVSYSILMFIGRQDDPEPTPGVCLFQVCLVYSTPILSVFCALSYIVEGLTDDDMKALALVYSNTRKMCGDGMHGWKRSGRERVAERGRPVAVRDVCGCHKGSDLGGNYRISPTPGKGLGMFATREYNTGDLIISEKPLMVVPRIPVGVLTEKAQQILPYIFEDPRGPHPVIPSDRPPLKPIRSPIPILTSADGTPGKAPKDLLVGIIGAGPAGLYAAMILDDLGIKYEILEGSNRHGGRILTHCFRSVDMKPWSYFFLEYNSQCEQQKTVNTKPTADWFKDSSSAGGLVPSEFINMGVDRWLGECFTPFKKLLAENWEKGWKKLMEFDEYSARTKKAYPNSAINWMERMNTGTGLFDMAFSEMVIDDLQFDWPTGSAMKFGGDGATDFDNRWHCLAGGSEVFINAMVSKISDRTQIKYSERVTSITPTAHGTRPLSVTYSSGGDKASNEYDYVISTIPLPALRFVDLDGCNLSYAQLEGIRTLCYDSSCKVGIRFSSRWWQTLDRLHQKCYTWSQDVARVGGLMNGRNTTDEQFLIDNILKGLSALHGVTFDFLKNELQDWCAWDWYSDPFTLGAFALFGPGQFKNIYPAFGQGAASGRLLFAGEALSDQHAWVEGALDSAYEAVRKMLEGAGLEECLERLEANWGNHYLDEAEAEEYQNLLREQELIGALFSTISDRDEIKNTLLGRCNEGHLKQSFLAAQAAQKA